MKQSSIALLAALVVSAGAAIVVAQAPQGPNNGVQVAVPQGSAADQRRDTQQQQRVAAERQRLASLPAPRSADGHIIIGATKEQKGVWIGSTLGFCNTGPAGPPSLNPGAQQQGRAAGGRAGAAGFGRGANAGPCTPVPYMAWTQAVSADRRRMQLEPHTRCKPSGGPREFLTPYGVEFVEIPELKVAYIFDIGGPHTYRTIYMDGRKHPDHLDPSFYGHSIGWWEGDTLVVDTVGFNEDFWIDRGQIPHTSQLHLTEKFTRTKLDTMAYELTVDDPGAYTKPFTGKSNLRWEAGTELFEYICQQENYAFTLMVGEGTSVDRTSPFVP
jgi:hypothetical protein